MKNETADTKENHNMAMKASKIRRVKRKKLPRLEPSVYAKVASSDLVVYSVHHLLEQNIDICMDDVVTVCFLLFPKKFALKKYSKWPDSAAVGRRWQDVRSKGYVTASTETGFKLTAKGKTLVKKVTKALGMEMPRQKVKIDFPVKDAQNLQTNTHVVTPLENIKVEISKKEPLPVMEQKAQSPQINADVIMPLKKAKVARKKKPPLPLPVKKIQVPQKKVQDLTPPKETETAKEEKPASPEPPNKISAPKLVKKDAPVKSDQVHPAAPIKHTKPIRAEKTSPPEPTVQALNVLIEAVNIPISREAKIRAEKFVRMMETSDAYIQYKKSGKNSNISEFDFRSLLLCTMESSAETLARNVEQFKGYADVHNRQDLITFLNFCKDQFSYLLTPQKKIIFKPPAQKAKK